MSKIEFVFMVAIGCSIERLANTLLKIVFA